MDEHSCRHHHGRYGEEDERHNESHGAPFHGKRQFTPTVLGDAHHQLLGVGHLG